MDKKKELQDILSQYFGSINPNEPTDIVDVLSEHLFDNLFFDSISKKVHFRNPVEFLNNAAKTRGAWGATGLLSKLDPSFSKASSIELSDADRAKIRDILASHSAIYTDQHLIEVLRSGYLSNSVYDALFDNDKQVDDFMEKLLLPVLNTPSDQHSVLWNAEDRIRNDLVPAREYVLQHLSRLSEKYPSAKLNIPLDYVESIPDSSQVLSLFNHPNVKASINRKIVRADDVSRLLGIAESKFHKQPEVLKNFVNDLKEKTLRDIGNNSASSSILQHLDELVNKNYAIPQYGGGTKALMADNYFATLSQTASKELFHKKLNEILDQNDLELAKTALHPLLTSGGSYRDYDPKEEERLLSLFDKINQTSTHFFRSSANTGLAKVYDAIWAKTHNSDHKEAARFWNEYEESVGNHHFPIVHAAMTKQHQKHRPYRTDRPGGNQDWIDSTGSEDLWEGIRQHGKVSQAAVLDLIHDDKMQHFFRKNARGDVYVKVMRGIGGKYGKIVSANHQLGGDVPVAPIQSWTLDPDTAMVFANNNRGVGGDSSRVVMHAWLPLKNLVHYGKMVNHSFRPKHPGETELIFHHPEPMIGLEKIHDIDVPEQREELIKQLHRTVLPDTTFKDIKDIAHRLKDDEYWKSISNSVRLKRHTEVKRTTKDPRYWADRFEQLSFDSPEHAQHYMKWAMGLRKGVDHAQMSAHFDVVPDDSGKFKLAIKPESRASLDAIDKTILEKKAKKGLNSHLINSPKYWIDRLTSGKAVSAYGHTPEAAKSLLEDVVKHFNNKNLQNVTVDHVMQFVDIQPNPQQFMSHISDEMREKAKGTVEFFPKDKYKTRQEKHEKLWNHVVAGAGISKKTVDQEMKMGAISPTQPDYAIMEAGKKNFLNAIVKHTGQEKDLERIKQNLDQYFHKFYKPKKVKISGPVGEEHFVFEPVDPLEKK